MQDNSFAVMRIEEFASLNRSWDKTIKRVGDYYFCRQHDAGYPISVYSAFPLNQKVKVDCHFINALKRKFLITQILLDLPKKDIYEYVLTTNSYDIEQFNKNCRKGIRKSLRVFSFREPNLQDLLKEGFEINQQTCERQSRTDEQMIDYIKWSKYVKTIHDTCGYTILGAYLENRMVGYLVTYELESKFMIVGAFIDRNHTSGASPMKGLLYTLMNNLIKKHGTVTLSYGFHKFSRPTPLTKFKESMLFQRHSYTKGYIVNPLLLPWLNLSVFIIIKLLKNKSFKRTWVRHTVRLYQGHRQLTKALKQVQPTGQNAEDFQVYKAA